MLEDGNRKTQKEKILKVAMGSNLFLKSITTEVNLPKERKMALAP
jgi:hypothetical protein